MIKIVNGITNISKIKLSTFVFLIILFACSENKINSAPIPEKIHEPVQELYKSLKVENESTPDFEYIISLFTSSAKLGYVREDSLILKSPEDYFRGMKGAVDNGTIKLLKEWEIKGETEHFGNVAHHISTYGVYFGTTDSIAERGVTSFQLVQLKDEWKIQSMIWNAESEELKIPAIYLD